MKYPTIVPSMAAWAIRTGLLFACTVITACEAPSSVTDTAPTIDGAVSDSYIADKLVRGGLIELKVGQLVSGTDLGWDGREESVVVDDSSIVAVTSDGSIVARSPGTTRLEFHFGDKLRSALVSVSLASVSSRSTSLDDTRRIVFTSGSSVVDSGSFVRFEAIVGVNQRSVSRQSRVSWSVEPSTHAVIQQDGTLTGLQVGEVTVNAEAMGVTRSVRVSILPVGRRNISVSPSALQLFVGGTGTVSISVTDESNNPLSAEGCTLYTRNPSIATAVGYTVVAVAVGSTYFIGECGSQRDSGHMIVTNASAPPQPPQEGCAPLPYVPSVKGDHSGSANFPELFPTSCITVPTRSISVLPGGNLQQALNSAEPGDEIVLTSGAEYVGNFVLPKKSGEKWITIRSSAAPWSPPSDERVSPGDGAAMAKILTPNSNPALSTAASASRFFIKNIEISNTAAVTSVSQLVELGDGSDRQNLLEHVPADIVLDRMFIHGTPSVELRRCVSLQSAATVVVNSHVSNCNNTHFDSQAIWGWNGPGPYLIENNYLEAATEVVGFGGATISVRGLVPSDVTIRRNHMTRTDEHKGRWLVKNLVEFKSGRRVLIEANVIERNWIHGQSGWGVVLTTANQPGNEWNVVSDITMRYNIFRKMGTWIQAGHDAVSPPPTRISLIHNIVYDINTGIYSGNGFAFISGTPVHSLDFINNTIVVPQIAFQTNGVGFQNFVVRDNVIAADNDGVVLHTPWGRGSAGFQHVAGNSWQMIGNGLVGISTSVSYPPGNLIVSSKAVAGFRNASLGDFTLLHTSPLISAGTGGSTPGADVDRVMSAVNRVTN